MSTAFLSPVFAASPFAHRCSTTSFARPRVSACAASPTSTPPASTIGRVFAPAETDVGALSTPIVHRYISDEDDRFAMWYTYRPRHWENSPHTPPGTLTGLIGLALSDDGVAWRRVDGPHNGAILPNNTEDWWAFDTVHVSAGDVLIDSNSRIRADSGVYFMYYSGGDKETVSVRGTDMEGIRMRIGLALSKDGEHFTRFEGPYPSSAVLDVGGEQEFDSLFVSSPHVVRVQNGYMMHYYTFNVQHKMYMVGKAFSADGLCFEKKGIALKGSGKSGAIDERGTQRAFVIKKGSVYFMFVVIFDSTRTTRIGVCQSNDCENWGPITVALDVGEKGSWDEKGVSHPYAVALDDGSALLYYVGKCGNHDIDAGNGTAIGLAKSIGTDWTRFSRTALEN
ncbi:Glycosyl hydrolase [Gracilaria domingensis]|nr:Glycosyl hydrolase [Gracilaria domingensis]